MKKNSLVKNSVMHVISRNKILIGTLVFLASITVLLGLIPPQILKHIIDYNFMIKSSHGLLNSALLYISVILFIGIFDFLKEAVLTVIGQKITKEIRIEMMQKLCRVNVMFFSRNESGKVVSKFTNDVDAVNSMFTNGIVGMVIDCFKIIGIIASIWIFSYRLGIVTLLLLPIIYAITRLFQKRMLKAQINNRILVGNVNNHISESFKNILMIKSFSKEEFMEKRYADVLIDNFNAMEKVNFYDSVFSPIIIIIRALVISSIVILSSGKLNVFDLSLGMVAASIDLISNLFNPVESLGMELQSIQQSISGMHRINQFYEEKEDEKKTSSDNFVSDLNSGFIISFNNMSFAYEDGNEILKNINLKIDYKEKVSFAGRTGVGKTTLFKLVSGLLKPTNGNITINGQDVYDIPNSQKRKIFGYADQSFHTIKGTVAEQISLKDKDINMEQIKYAIDFVGLTDYVNSLERGYYTEVNNENIFSQGQKQLLSIARAIVTNPPILLLDEITSNLDSITEEKIVDVLHRAGQKHTVLTISHRLSSLVSSDRVVILENGEIKNSGSPEMLLEKDDWYKNHIAMEKLTWS